MKKILFLIDTLNGGGAEKILIDIIDNLDKSKFDITIMTVWNRGIYKQVIDSKNYNYKTILEKNSQFKLINLFIEKFFYICSGKLLHKIFIKEKYDVEIAFLEGISTKIISGASSDIKKFSWIHTDMKSNTWYSQFYINKKSIISTYKRFNKIYAVSKECKDKFIDLFRIKNVEVIYNPVDNNMILEKSLEETKLINHNNKIKIVTVGRLEYEKGYDRLINIARRLKDERFEFEIYIIGSGSLKDEFENKIRQYNLTENVFLLGYLKNPYSIVRRSDLFVCSSRIEGFSTVVTEALVLGIPVVTTLCGGMEELLGNNEYGIITENSEESLYTSIKTLLTDVELINLYKKKAMIRGKDFTLDKSIGKIVDLLK